MPETVGAVSATSGENPRCSVLFMIDFLVRQYYLSEWFRKPFLIVAQVVDFSEFLIVKFVF